ncbi:MAG: PIG-L family deacetylase, partial [Hymenobacteraceae bacterium]|nr:PIG-L family deacetylase [Hymenobacteraceae bacterium]MDX5512593.1 PIG-L family deacetylase [Hymenobacteraceae bacterium]
PDDENTRLIAYLANDKLYRTGYLSLTRGDGGQNLIGSEIREELGLIRTQELLQARRTDGGQQFFTRANDFGFSKNPEETFTIWDKEQVLADVVWTIRKFRPDVIVTRFSPVPGNTHGHHTASAQLAMEAFDAAADPKRFPEQLAHVQVWQPKRLVWNTSYFFFRDQKEFEEYNKNLFSLDVGTYNSLLGKSHNEIAAEARSMHKSQGFGAALSRGSTKEYFELLKGEAPKNGLLDGINTSWSRVDGSRKVSRLLQKAADQFNPEKPSDIVPLLLQAKQELAKLPDSHWKKVKQEELQEVLRASLGLYLEASASDYAVAKNQSVKIKLEAINRSDVPVQLLKLKLPFNQKDTTLVKLLPQNEQLVLEFPVDARAASRQSQPYWLREPGTLGMFKVVDQKLIGLPENEPVATVTADVSIKGQGFTFDIPVIHKSVDPAVGEQYRPFVVTPPVFVNVAEPVYVLADKDPKTVRVQVQAGQPNVQGQVKLDLPKGWRSEPLAADFNLPQKGQTQTVEFKLFAPEQASEGELQAYVMYKGQRFSQGIKEIKYSHIPTQVLFPEATAKVVKLDIKIKGKDIAYVMGAGDEVPASLRQIGYDVTVLQPHELTEKRLKKFDAVIMGVRAYNTVDELRFRQAALLEYVKDGGTMIVQYNTSHALVLPELGPYPLKLSRDRVTVEEAPVTFLKPQHKVLNEPNKITQKDFEGWVQERGLYFPNEWSSEYEAILSANDPGEPARNGGLLVAKYGEGYYIYTGYSWFRELPAGVPGAYRIVANLISIGN